MFKRSVYRSWRRLVYEKVILWSQPPLHYHQRQTIKCHFHICPHTVYLWYRTGLMEFTPSPVKVTAIHLWQHHVLKAEMYWVLPKMKFPFNQLSSGCYFSIYVPCSWWSNVYLEHSYWHSYGTNHNSMLPKTIFLFYFHFSLVNKLAANLSAFEKCLGIINRYDISLIVSRHFA